MEILDEVFDHFRDHLIGLLFILTFVSQILLWISWRLDTINTLQTAFRRDRVCSGGMALDTNRFQTHTHDITKGQDQPQTKLKPIKSDITPLLNVT